MSAADVGTKVPAVDTAAAPAETKVLAVDAAIAAAAPASGYTRQVYSALTNAYHGAKLNIATRITIPEMAAAQLLKVESAIGSKLESSMLVNVIDSNLDCALQFVKDEASKRVTYIADSTAKRVELMASRPVVKNLVAPATAAVVSGFLEAGDVVIEYALPEPAIVGESKELATAESTLVVPHAKNLAFKLQRRLKQRAATGIASLDQRKAYLMKRKSDLMQVDLIAYAKGFIGTTQMDTHKPAADLKKMTKFAVGVLEPYRRQLKGQWNMNVQPVLLCVTNYGEYFMEHVHEYEKGSEETADKVLRPATDSQINALISHVAHQYVEPALVRTVAVFMVLGDEMKRIRVDKIVPQVTLAKDRATEAVKNVAERVSGQYEEGLKTIGGERVKFVDFAAKVAAYAKSVEFEALVGPVLSKVYEAIQAMPWGEQKIMLEEFKTKVMERIGNKVISQIGRTKKEVCAELEKLHALIYLAKEWATRGVLAETKEGASPDIGPVTVTATDAETKGEASPDAVPAPVAPTDAHEEAMAKCYQRTALLLAMAEKAASNVTVEFEDASGMTVKTFEALSVRRDLKTKAFHVTAKKAPADAAE